MEINYNEANEALKAIRSMPDDAFENFCKRFTPEQAFLFASMRFYERLFGDPDFYNKVQNAIGEEAYKELRFAD